MEVVIFLVMIGIGIGSAYLMITKSGKVDNDWTEEKEELLEKYEEILEKNRQEIEKIKQGDYCIESWLDVSSEEDKKNGLIDGRLGYSYIKNNTLFFIEEAVQLDDPYKASTKVLEERGQEPVKIEIKFESIKYYTINGDVRFEQEITGTGGGSSLGGAVLGGIVAGGAGAIIGSRKGIAINTTNRKIDEREFMIKTMDNKKYIFYNLELYEALFDLIPEKEYEVYKKNLGKDDNIQNEKKNSIGKNDDIQDKKNDNLSQLEKLAELKEKGIITEEDFEKSKQKILEKL